MLINLILGCDFIQTYNENLQNNKVYKQKLKLNSKGLSEELNKFLSSNLKIMFDIDEEIYQNISRNFDE